MLVSWLRVAILEARPRVLRRGGRPPVFPLSAFHHSLEVTCRQLFQRLCRTADKGSWGWWCRVESEVVGGGGARHHLPQEPSQSWWRLHQNRQAPRQPTPLAACCLLLAGRKKLGHATNQPTGACSGGFGHVTESQRRTRRVTCDRHVTRVM